ncbi:MAG: 50S ribosomal protein L4 [Promethearchaeia archaeon]
MEKVINVYGLVGGKIKETITVPRVFSHKPRKDIVLKSFEVEQSKKKQNQGRDKRAGLRNTAEGWGTGHGMSRAPRIKGSGFPTARNVGTVPFAVGGRRAHPVKNNEKIEKKINKKTKNISILSAISASGKEYWIKERGHIIENVPEIPLVVDDKIQTIKKTNKLYSVLIDLGLKRDLERAKKKIRAGKGKRRGRKYKRKKSILIVIKENFGIVRAARNIPGVDIIKLKNISIGMLAPGGKPGRLIVWSSSAFKELEKYDKELI